MGILDKIKGKKTDEEVKATVTETPVAKTDVKEIKAEKSSVAKKTNSADKKAVSGILISPIVTEKSAKDEQYGKYVFLVEISASKNEIKKAVESRYGLKPVKVNIVCNDGKIKRYGRFWGQRKDIKKAIVTLPKGKSINVYDNK